MRSPSAKAPTGPAAPRLARALLAGALVSAAAAVFVACTGGFRVEAGPWRFSMRSPWPSLAASVLTAVIGMLLAPRALVEHADAFRGWLQRRGAALALAASLATGLAGLIHGSAVPSGADASGYLSQAVLWRSGRLVVPEPAMLDAPWPNAAWTFSPLGYRPARAPGELVPTYPPGLPLHFAVAGAAAGEWGVRAVVPLLGALGVWAAFVLGRRLAGPVAGLSSAVLLATSPPWLNQLVQPMSDVPVTAWWLASLTIASHPSRPALARAALAGVAAGLAWLVRPNLVLLLPLPLLLALRRRAGATWQPVSCTAAFVCGLAPAVALLAIVNWKLYGAPWASGYGSAAELFSLSFVGDNLRLYTGWLLDVHGPLLAGATAGLVAAGLSMRRHPAVPGLWLALLLLMVAVSASYLVYAPFESWAYLRFLLPAIAGLAIVAGIAIAALASLRPPWAPVAAVLVLVAMAGTSWHQARQLGVFSTAQREQRHALAAEWVQRHAPAGVRWLASQHSGSLHAITRRPVVRWDLLDPGHAPDGGRAWLDLAWRGAAAREDFGAGAAWLVLDAEEEPAFRRRFAAVSELGRLDWPPSATTAPPLSVRVYTLDDRARYFAGEAVETVRITAGSGS